MAFSVISKASLRANYIQAFVDGSKILHEETRVVTPEELGGDLTRMLIEARLAGKESITWVPVPDLLSDDVETGTVHLVDSVVAELEAAGYVVEDARHETDPEASKGIIIKFPATSPPQL